MINTLPNIELLPKLHTIIEDQMAVVKEVRESKDDIFSKFDDMKKFMNKILENINDNFDKTVRKRSDLIILSRKLQNDTDRIQAKCDDLMSNVMRFDEFIDDILKNSEIQLAMDYHDFSSDIDKSYKANIHLPRTNNILFQGKILSRH